MRFTKLLALVGLFAGSALAAPTEDPRPQKPAKPAPAPPTNGCGNDATPYCCNTDIFGIGSCYSYRMSILPCCLLRISIGKVYPRTNKDTSWNRIQFPVLPDRHLLQCPERESDLKSNT